MSDHTAQDRDSMYTHAGDFTDQQAPWDYVMKSRHEDRKASKRRLKALTRSNAETDQSSRARTSRQGTHKRRNEIQGPLTGDNSRRYKELKSIKEEDPTESNGKTNSDVETEFASGSEIDETVNSAIPSLTGDENTSQLETSGRDDGTDIEDESDVPQYEFQFGGYWYEVPKGDEVTFDQNGTTYDGKIARRVRPPLTHYLDGRRGGGLWDGVSFTDRGTSQ